MKRCQIEVTSSASIDIQDAVSYYDEISKTVADKFLDDLEHTLQIIKKNPHFQIRYKEIRCLRLKKFPFLVHFQLVETEPLAKVIAVLHTSRDTKDWNLKV